MYLPLAAVAVAVAAAAAAATSNAALGWKVLFNGILGLVLVAPAPRRSVRAPQPIRPAVCSGAIFSQFRFREVFYFSCVDKFAPIPGKDSCCDAEYPSIHPSFLCRYNATHTQIIAHSRLDDGDGDGEVWTFAHSLNRALHACGAACVTRRAAVAPWR